METPVGNTWSELLKKYKLMFQIGTADSVITIKNSTIKARNINVIADNTVNMKTYGFFLAANLVNADTIVDLKDCTLEARNSIALKSIAYIDVFAKRVQKVGAAYGMTTSVVLGTNRTQVSGRSSLTAGGSILIEANTTLKTEADQFGGRTNDAENGGVLAFSLVSFDTAAEVSGNTTLNAGKDITVHSVSNGTATTRAILHGFTETEGMYGKNNTIMFRVRDGLDVIGMMYNGKTFASSAWAQTGGRVTKAIGEILKPAIDAIKEKLDLANKVQAPDVSQTQYSGALALGWADVTNRAVITAKGTITAGGSLSVLAEASTVGSVEADAATMAASQGGPKDGTVVAQLKCGNDAVPTQFTLMNAGALSMYLNQIPTETGTEVTFGETVQSRLGIGHYYLLFTVDESKYKVKDLNAANSKITRLYYTEVPREDGRGTRTMATYRYTLWLAPAQVAVDGDHPTDYVMTTKGERVTIQLEKLDAEQQVEKPDSKGIGIAVDINAGKNEAYIEDSGDVHAANVEVVADNLYKDVEETDKDGNKVTKKVAIENSATAKAQSGTSTGKTGLSGAIALNYDDITTGAYIKGITLDVCGGNVRIAAGMAGAAATAATGSKTTAKESGKGGSVAIGYATFHTTATLAGNVKLIGSPADLIVSAKSSGSKAELNAASGAKSDKSGSAAIAVNVVKETTIAEIPVETAEGGALKLNNITVSASSDRKQVSKGNDSVTNGASGVGATLALDWTDLTTKAVLSRTAEVEEALSVTATGKSANAMNIVSTAAGMPREQGEAANAPAAEGQLNGLIEAVGLQENPNLQLDAPEAKFGLAAVAALAYRNETVQAVLEGKTTVGSELTVNATAIRDISVKGNAGATIQDTGVGVGVAALVSTAEVDSKVSGEHTAGWFSIAAEMPYKLEENEEGESEREDEASQVSVIAYSGAGASTVAGAGAGAFNWATEDYTATVEGRLTATSEEEGSTIHASAIRDVTTQASGSADNNGIVSEEDGPAGDEDEEDTSMGVGASFAWDNGGIKAQALIKQGAVVVTAGDLDVSSYIRNGLETTAEAGGDAYEEPATDGLVKLSFLDGNGKAVECTAYVIVYKVGEPGSTTWPTDFRGGLMYTGKVITFAAQKGYIYYLKVVNSSSDLKFAQLEESASFTIDEETKGYSQTWVLTKKNEPQFYNTALDASVALNLIDCSSIARIEAGAVVRSGALNLEAGSESTTSANGGSEAQSSNNAVGATVAINVIKEEVKAELLGSVVTEDLSVLASATTQDIAETLATARGVDLDRYERNLAGWGADKVEDGIKSRIPAKYLPGKSKVGQNLNNGLNNVGAGEGGREVGEDAPLGERVLGALNVQAEERREGDADQLDHANVEAGNAQGALANAGEAESNKYSITVAAAIGVNAVKHITEATVTGMVTATGDIEVSATNKNDIKTMGDASSVAAKTALATGVSVVVNNSEATATVNTGFADIEDEDDEDEEEEDSEGKEEEDSEGKEEEDETEEEAHEIGSVKITAETKVNMSKEFADQVAAQAIAGSGIGSREGRFAFAGAVAVASSNAKTTAVWTIPQVSLQADGAIEVTATEKIRFSSRAWAGALQNRYLNDDSSKPSSTKGSGVGMACGWVKSDNTTEARILTAAKAPVTLTATAVKVEARKQKVSTADYEYSGFRMNGVIQVGLGFYSLPVKVNTTAYTPEPETQSADIIGLSDLIDIAKTEGIKGLNYLASRNYYVEAVGGTVLANAQNVKGIAGSGAFAILDLKDTIDSELGDGLTIAAGAVSAKSESEVNIVQLGGAVGLGGDVGAGIVVDVLDNRTTVRSTVGAVAIKKAKTVDMGATNHAAVTSLAAAVATPGIKTGKYAVAGTMNIVYNKPQTLAVVKLTGINADEDAELADSVKLTADERLTVRTAGGGLSLAGKLGGGAALTVTRSEALTEAISDNEAVIRAKDVAVSASDLNDVIQWAINGSVVTEGTSLELTPAIVVSKNETYAYLKNARVESASEGTVSVKASSITDIFNVAGNIAGAAKNAGSVSASWVALDNKTRAELSGAVKGAGVLDVLGNAGEKITAFSAGAAVGLTGTAAQGSLGVAVVDGEVYAGVAKGTEIRNIAKQLSVKATNALESGYIAGGAAVTNMGYAVGASIGAMASNINVKAELGDGVKAFAEAVEVAASKTEDSLMWIAVGGASFKGGLEAAINSTSLKGNNIVSIGKGVEVDCDRATISALSDIKSNTATIGIAFGFEGCGGAAIEAVQIKGTNGVYVGEDASIVSYRDGVAIDAGRTVDTSALAVGLQGSTAAAVGASISSLELSGTNEVVTSPKVTVRSLGSVSMNASDNRTISQTAGEASVSGKFAMGVGVARVLDTSTTRVKTEGSASGFSAGANSPKKTYTGVAEESDKKYIAKTDLLSGFSAAAVSVSDIRTMALNGGIAGTVSAGAGINGYTDESTVSADIDGTVDSAPGISVLAFSDSRVKASGADANLSGAAAVGAGIIVSNITRNVQATLGGTVTAKDPVQVRALNNTDLKGVTVGVVIGQGSVAGSVGILNDTSTTRALLYGTVKTQGDLSVIARRSAKSDELIGGVEIGLYAGVGASVLVENRKATVEAAIADDAEVESKGLDVLAALSETHKSQVGNATGGTFAGLGASVDVVNSQSTVRAAIGRKVRITATGDVNVNAVGKHTYDLSGGIFSVGAAEAGPSVGAVYINDSVSAVVGEKTVISAKDISVTAGSERELKLKEVSAGGGVVAFQGSWALVRIGKDPDSEEGNSSALSAIADLVRSSGKTAASQTSVEGTDAASQAIQATEGKGSVAGYEQAASMFESSRYDHLATGDRTTATVAAGAKLKADGKIVVAADSETSGSVQAGSLEAGALSVGISKSSLKDSSDTLVTVLGDLIAKQGITIRSGDSLGKEKESSVFKATLGSAGAAGYSVAEATVVYTGSSIVDIAAVKDIKETIELTSELGNINVAAGRRSLVKLDTGALNIEAIAIGSTESSFTQKDSALVKLDHAKLVTTAGTIDVGTASCSGSEVTADYTSLKVIGGNSADAKLTLSSLSKIEMKDSVLDSANELKVQAVTCHEDKVTGKGGSGSLSGYGAVNATGKLWDEASISIRSSALKARKAVSIKTFPYLKSLRIQQENHLVKALAFGRGTVELGGLKAQEGTLSTADMQTEDRYTINSLIVIDGSRIESTMGKVEIASVSKQDTEVDSDCFMLSLTDIANVVTTVKSNVNDRIDLGTNTVIKAVDLLVDAHSGEHRLVVSTDTTAFGAWTDVDVTNTLALDIRAALVGSGVTVETTGDANILAQIGPQEIRSKVFAYALSAIPTGKVEAVNATTYTSTLDLRGRIKARSILIDSNCVDGTNEDVAECVGIDKSTYHTTNNVDSNPKRSASTHVDLTLDGAVAGFNIDENGNIVGDTTGIIWEQIDVDRIINIIHYDPSLGGRIRVLSDQKVSGDVRFDKVICDIGIDNYSDYTVRFYKPTIEPAKLNNLVTHKSRKDKSLDTLVVHTIPETTERALIVTSHDPNGSVEFVDQVVIKDAGLRLIGGRILGTKTDAVKTDFIEIKEAVSVGAAGLPLKVALTRTDTRADAGADGDIYLQLLPAVTDKDHKVSITEVSCRGKLALELMGVDDDHQIRYSLNRILGNDISVRGIGKNIIAGDMEHSKPSTSTVDPYRVVVQAYTQNAVITGLSFDMDSMVIKAQTQIDIDVIGRIEDLVFWDTESNPILVNVKLAHLKAKTEDQTPNMLIDAYLVKNGIFKLYLDRQDDPQTVVTVVNKLQQDVDYRITFDDGDANTLCIVDSPVCNVSTVKLIGDDKLSIVQSDMLPTYDVENSTLWLKGGWIGTATSPMTVLADHAREAYLDVRANDDIALAIGATKDVAENGLTVSSVTTKTGDVSLHFNAHEQDPISDKPDLTVYQLDAVTANNITLSADKGTVVGGLHTVLTSKEGTISAKLGLKADTLTVTGMERAELALTHDLSELVLDCPTSVTSNVTVGSLDGMTMPKKITALLPRLSDSLSIIMNGSDRNSQETAVAVDAGSRGKTEIRFTGSKDVVRASGKLSDVTATLATEKGSLLISDDEIADTGNTLVLSSNGQSSSSRAHVRVTANEASVNAAAKGSVNLIVEDATEEGSRIAMDEIRSENGDVSLHLNGVSGKDTSYRLSTVAGRNLSVEAPNSAITGQDILLDSKGGRIDLVNVYPETDSLTVRGMSSADLTLTSSVACLKVETVEGTEAQVKVKTPGHSEDLPARIIADLVNEKDALDIDFYGDESNTQTTVLDISEGSKGHETLHMKGYIDTAVVKGSTDKLTVSLDQIGATVNLTDSSAVEGVNNVILDSVGSKTAPLDVRTGVFRGTVTATAKDDIFLDITALKDLTLGAIESSEGSVEVKLNKAGRKDEIGSYSLSSVSGKDITINAEEGMKVIGDAVLLDSKGGTVTLATDLKANSLTVKGMAAAALEVSERLKALNVESVEGTDASVSVTSRDGESLPERVDALLVNKGDTLDITLSGTADKGMATELTVDEESKGTVQLHFAGSVDTATVKGSSDTVKASLEKKGAGLNITDGELKAAVNNLVLESIGSKNAPLSVKAVADDATLTANAAGDIRLSADLVGENGTVLVNAGGAIVDMYVSVLGETGTVGATAVGDIGMTVSGASETAGTVKLSEIASSEGSVDLQLRAPVHEDTAYELSDVTGKDITIQADDGANVTGDRVVLESRGGEITLDADLTANSLTVKGMAKTALEVTDKVKALTVETTEGTRAFVTVTSKDGESLPTSITAKLANAADALDIMLDGTAEKPKSTELTVSDGSEGSVDLYYRGTADAVKVNGSTENVTAYLEKDGATLSISDGDTDDTVNGLTVETIGTEEAPLQVKVTADSATITADTTGDIALDVEAEGRNATITAKADGDIDLTAKVTGDAATVNANAKGNLKLDATAEGKDAKVTAEATGSIEMNVDVKGADGSVTAKADGDIDLTAKVNGDAATVSANTKGNLKLDAKAEGKDATVTAEATGSIDLTAKVNGDAAKVTAEATGSIEMNADVKGADGSVTAKADGDIDLTAKVNGDAATVNANTKRDLKLEATAEGDDAKVTAEATGSIEMNADVKGADGSVTAKADGNIDLTAKVNGDAATVSASTKGDLKLEATAEGKDATVTAEATGSIEMNADVKGADGSVTAKADGNIDLTAKVNGDGATVNANTKGDLKLDATAEGKDAKVTAEATGSIEMNADVKGADGSVTAKAEGNIDLTAKVNGDDAKVTAEATGSIEMNADVKGADGSVTAKADGNIDLTAKVNGDAATVSANTKGDLKLDATAEGKDATVTAEATGSIDMTADVKGADGSVTAKADGNIDLTAKVNGDAATVSASTKGDLKLDATAEGKDATVTAEATGSIDMDADVKGADGSVTAKADGNIDLTAKVNGDNTTVDANTKGDLKLDSTTEGDDATVTARADGSIEANVELGGNNGTANANAGGTVDMDLKVSGETGTVGITANGDIDLGIESTSETAGNVRLEEIASKEGSVEIAISDPINSATSHTLTTVSGKDITISANEAVIVNGKDVLLDSHAGNIDLDAKLAADSLTVKGMATAELKPDEGVKALTVTSNEGTTALVGVESRDGSTLPGTITADLVNAEDLLRVKLNGTEDHPMVANVNGTDRSIGTTELALSGVRDTANVSNTEALRVVVDSTSMRLTDDPDMMKAKENNVVVDAAGTEAHPIELVSTGNGSGISVLTEGDVFLKASIRTDETNEHVMDLSDIRSENGTASLTVTAPVRTDGTANAEADATVRLDSITARDIVLKTEDTTVAGGEILLESTDKENGTIKVDAAVNSGRVVVKNMAEADLKLSDLTARLEARNEKGMHSDVTISGRDGSIVGSITSQLKNKGDTINVVMSGTTEKPMETTIRKVSGSRADYTVRFTGDTDTVRVRSSAKVDVYMGDAVEPARHIAYNGIGYRSYHFYPIDNLLRFSGRPVSVKGEEPLVIVRLEKITQITALVIRDAVASIEARALEDRNMPIDPDEVIIVRNLRMAEVGADSADIRMTEKLHIVLDLKALLEAGYTDELRITYLDGIITVLAENDTLLTLSVGTLPEEHEVPVTVSYNGTELTVLCEGETLCELEVPMHASVAYADGALSLIDRTNVA